MKVWILYESYWNDPHSYVQGITGDANTAIHWKNTKPSGLAGRDIVSYETIDDILNLDRTINTEEHRKHYEKVPA